MAQTILNLVKSACYRSNAQMVPSALVGSTDAGALQLLHLFYSVGEELRALGCWPQLKRRFKVRLVAGQSRYDLPADFYRISPLTEYDQSNAFPIAGPITDADRSLQVIGTTWFGDVRTYRLFGFGGGQFEVTPTPAASDNITSLSFEYISKSWLQPPAWTASETGLAQNVYRQYQGIIYKKTDSGTDTAGTVPPTLYFGEGQDGAVRWLALTTNAFSTTTLYAPGEYVTTGGRLYRVTVGGTSGGSAPTSTTENTDITNGTCTLRYHSAASWAGETSYNKGAHILISGQYYRCEESGVSGKNTPTWTTTKFVDNTIDWTFQDIAYESLITDSDLCVFDDEIMIAGLRAKLFEARGIGAGDLEASYQRMKNAALARMNIGKVIDFAVCVDSGVAYPTINWTGSNWTVS